MWRQVNNDQLSHILELYCRLIDKCMMNGLSSLEDLVKSKWRVSTCEIAGSATLMEHHLHSHNQEKFLSLGKIVIVVDVQSDSHVIFLSKMSSTSDCVDPGDRMLCRPASFKPTE